MVSFLQYLDLIVYVFTRFYELLFRRKKNASSECLVGKTAIVTGGNGGIGSAVAITLASRGCKVIIADCQNAEATRDSIIASTGNKNVVYKHLDLSSLKSVRNFAADICKTEEKIDILVNNAGIGLTKKLVTEDGLNYLMQVNIFGAFLLTHLLLEPLKRSQSAKIIFLSSIAAIMDDLTLKNLNITNYEMDDEYRLMLYANSKICCILAAQGFGKKLEKHGITANSIDPLAVKTNIFENLQDYGNAPLSLALRVGVKIFAQDPLDVARSFEYVISKKGSDTNGKNFVLSHIAKKPRVLRNKKLCEDIWTEMEELVKLKPEERIRS